MKLPIKKNSLITGALLLSAAGLASRFIGFFYRIFMSRTFGEEGMGIYQLTGPVSGIVFAISTAGIHNAVSRFIAGDVEKNDYRSSLRILGTGLFFSTILSALCSFFIYQNSEWIASRFLYEPRCASLLRIIALSFVPASIHSCINGYFYGIHKTGIPASTQLIEQLARVGTVFLLWYHSLSSHAALSLNVAAIGLCVGEFTSMTITLTASYFHFLKRAGISRKSSLSALGNLQKKSVSTLQQLSRLTSTSRKMLLFALPLSANRLCLNLLSALEAAWLPIRLQQFGYSVSESLSIYGVFTGMAMTLILFPGTFTNSVSVLLMPLVAEADAVRNTPAISRAIRKCIRYCFLLGCGCMFFFLLFGEFLGIFLFDSDMAGRFIMTLSFICPFLYLNTTLFGILHGLGKTGFTFFLNMAGILLRLVFICTLVPVFGMKAYFWAMLASQLLSTFSSLLKLRPYLLPAKSS